jgi:predicted flap endonuclease-1-like 5' DNA nuclease
MRTDYALYTVAIIFFIITGIVCFYQVEYKELWIVATAALGIFFAGVGYAQRPKTTKKVTVETTLSTTSATTVQKEKLSLEAAQAKTLKLTDVKGIGTKRAEQLKAVGITGVEDLAKASAEDLASKLGVSPKTTGKWIEEAKKLLKKQ